MKNSFLPTKVDKFELTLFLMSFFYVFLAALIIQFYIVPNLLSKYHWGLGLLKFTDAVTYHNLATAYTEYLKEFGLGSWEFIPHLSESACLHQDCNFYGTHVDSPVTGVLSLFYYFIESKPWAFILFNAMLHGSSAVLIFRILKKSNFNSKVVLFATFPFVFFPSSAQWWAAIGKDGMFIFGILLFIYSINNLTLSQEKIKLRRVFILFFSLFVILSIRPYYKDFILIYLLIGFAVINLPKFNFYPTLKLLLVAAIFTLWQFLSPPNFVAPLSMKTQLNQPQPTQLNQPQPTQLNQPQPTQLNQPQPTQVIDQGLQISDKPKKNISKLTDRIFLKSFGRLNNVRDNFSYYKGVSDIDPDLRVKNFEDLIYRFPRLLQVTFFSPFPDMWFPDELNSKSKIMRGVSAIEMIIYYIALVAILFSFFEIIKNKHLTFILLISFVSMFIISYTIPNIGTLYRMRFIFFIFATSIGLLFLLNNFYVRRNKENKN